MGRERKINRERKRDRNKDRERERGVKERVRERERERERERDREKKRWREKEIGRKLRIYNNSFKNLIFLIMLGSNHVIKDLRCTCN